MAASTRGPYHDNPEDFAHLDKVKIKVMVSWLDDDGDQFRARDQFEVSTEDDLFAMLTRRAVFSSWRRLSVLPDRYHLYRHHGEAWFEADPDGIRRDVEQAVRRFQADLFAFPRRREPPIFCFEVARTPAEQIAQTEYLLRRMAD